MPRLSFAAALAALSACQSPAPADPGCDASGTTPEPTVPPAPTEPPPTDTATSEPTGARSVEWFQAVQVPLLEDGAVVDVADRNAPVIAGRAAVVRVTPEAAGPVTLELGDGGAVARFSADSDGGPVVLEVPADAIDADTTWALHTSTGDVPASPLGATETGPIRVHLVPFQVDGFVPDTSAAVVEGYRAAMLAMYPVTDVELTVGSVEVWDGALDLGEINVQVGILQEDAMWGGRSDWNVYWYGMVSGVATREEFSGITGTSEDGGDAPTRAFFAAGAAFGDQKSEDTFVHEIGHTQGLMHTACDGEANPDPDYPYAGGTIGREGYDRRTGAFLSADDHYDLMSYCFPRWVSDHSFAKLAERIADAQLYTHPE